MLILKSSAVQNLVFLMIDSADHLAGKTGLTPTVTLSKNGATFAAPAGAVTEIASGWYKVAANATDVNTLGSLVLHAESAGADPVDMVFEIVAYDPQDAAGLGLSRVDAAVSSRSTFAGGEVASVTGNVGGNVSGTVKLDATQPDYAPAKATDPMILTSAYDAAKGAAGENKTATGFSIFNPATDTVANVALVATTTINTDMRGTDGAYAGTPPTPPTAAAISTAVWSETTRELTAFSFLTYAGTADAVWDEIISTHTTTGSAGAGLSAAGSAGDPWSAALPGTYAAGSAGKIVGDNINAAISTRSTFDATSDPVKLDPTDSTAKAIADMTQDDGAGKSQYAAKALELAPSGGGGSGGLTPTQQDQLTGAYEKTKLLTSGGKTQINGPLSEDGQSMALVRGDTYAANSPRGAITWTPADDADWPDLTGAAGLFTVRLKSSDAKELEQEAVITNPAGPNKQVSVTLTAAQTEGLQKSEVVRDHKFDLQLTLTNQDVWTPIRGGGDLTAGGLTVFETQTRST